MLGVPAATIRSWEDRYRLVVPARTATGHRLYRRSQVEQLRFVRARMAEGLSAADAHRLLAERLDASPGSLPQTPFRDLADLADPAAGSAADHADPAADSAADHAGLAADPADRAAARTDAPAAQPQPAAAILLADPDRYAAEMHEQFLASAGFEVEVALSEAEARRVLSIRRPAVAVIEPLISGGSGLELCRSFKRSGVPVIVASVLQAREQALAAGADAFLGKPLNPVGLLSAVRDLLAQSPYAHLAEAVS